MGYRINLRKKTVDVVGEADLDAIVRKVTRFGGTGWRLTTSIPMEVVESMVERVTERTTIRPIGFRHIATEGDAGLVTGLPFTPPTEDE